MGVEIGEDGTGFVSRDAQHSTYAPATPTPEEEAFPPNGPGTEQTLGKPAEVGGTTKTSKTTSTSS